MSQISKGYGLLGKKFMLALALMLVSLVMRAIGDMTAVRLVFAGGVAVLLLAAASAAGGGIEIAREKGYSALAGVLAGLTWPIGAMILLSLDSKNIAVQHEAPTSDDEKIG